MPSRRKTARNAPMPPPAAASATPSACSLPPGLMKAATANMLFPPPQPPRQRRKAKPSDCLCDSPLAVGDRVDDAVVTKVSASLVQGLALLSDGRIRCWRVSAPETNRWWADPTASELRPPRKIRDAIEVSVVGSIAMVLCRSGRVRCWSPGWQIGTPRQVQNRAVAVHSDGSAIAAVDRDGRLHVWGSPRSLESVPFKLTDEAWLEFATRKHPRTKIRLFPPHVRKLPQFEAIVALNRLSRS